MSTTTTTLPKAPAKPRTLVDMNWDPITRIVGSLGIYGRMIRKLRAITNTTVNKEPKWRHKGTELTTGYRPRAF